MLLAAPNLYKTLVPQWAGIGRLRRGSRLLLPDRSRGRALRQGGRRRHRCGGRPGGGLEPASLAARPDLWSDSNIDAWKKITSLDYVNSIKLWTGVNLPNTQWGIALVGAGVLMLIFGVLPGRFGLLAIIPSLVVPYAFLHTMVLVQEADSLTSTTSE